MTDGIVKFPAALYAKLSQTPRNVGMEALAQSSARLADRIERERTRRAQMGLYRERMKAEQSRFEATQAGMERRHTEDIQARKDISAAETAAAEDRQTTQLGATAREKMLDRFAEGLKVQAQARAKAAEEAARSAEEAREAAERERHNRELEHRDLERQLLDEAEHRALKDYRAATLKIENAKTAKEHRDATFEYQEKMSKAVGELGQRAANLRGALGEDFQKDPAKVREYNALRLRLSNFMYRTFGEKLSDQEVEEAVESMLIQGKRLPPRPEPDELDPMKQFFTDLLRKSTGLGPAAGAAGPASQPARPSYGAGITR